MPLSEHEQRLLEQMERALYADDPKLASTLRGARVRGYDRRKVVLGVVGVVVGIGLLLAGVAKPFGALGVVGFLVMLSSAWLVMSGYRSRAAAAPATATDGSPTAKSRKPKSAGFMNRLEERWDRRRNEGQN
ncbi:MAG: DUF3040 domain-containing protein [Actinomycetes bacterium]